MNKPATNYRWRIVALLFFATTINYIDRQVIGILKPYIQDDLGWTETGYGYIVMSFQIAYAAGLLTTGRFLDRFGTRIGYSVAIVLWSIAGIMHATARSVMSFAAMRFLLGIGESANFPAAVKTVAEWFPKKERALATGWFNIGSSVGAFLTPLIVSGIFLSLGWRWAFIITGTFGLIWVIFWLSWYRPPSQHPHLGREEHEYILSDNDPGQTGSVSMMRLLGYRSTWAIGLSRFITEWVWWFILFWTPDFLNKVHGVNIKELVVPLIIIYSFAGFGGIAGGWLSSKLIKNGKTVNTARKTAILFCALIVTPVILVPHVEIQWSVLFITCAAFGHQAWASNIFTVVSDIYPKNVVGSMTGLAGFAGAAGGALSAPFIGLLLDITGSYFLIFLVAGCVYLLAWLILTTMIKDSPVR